MYSLWSGLWSSFTPCLDVPLQLHMIAGSTTTLRVQSMYTLHYMNQRDSAHYSDIIILGILPVYIGHNY